MRAWITMLLAVLTLAAQRTVAGPLDIFCIGTPDGMAMEFGMFLPQQQTGLPVLRQTGIPVLRQKQLLMQERPMDLLKAFPKPVEYTVGKSATTDWPYLHPGPKDNWAGVASRILSQ